MIVVNAKSDAKASSPLATPDKEPSLSFSQLLKGVVTKDKPANGAIVLSLENEKPLNVASKTSSKKESLLSLLKGDKAKESEPPTKLVTEQKDAIELNPKLTQNMSPKELKALVSDAKEYLKSKILESDEYKKSQVKELPTTLRGLATMAKNFGIDVSKLSLEEVRVKPDAKSDVLLKSKSSKIDAKSQNTNTTGSEQKTPTKAEMQNVVEDKKLDTRLDAKLTSEIINKTPLFKAAEAKEHSTEQIVVAKQFKIEQKTPKEKADETLKLLLRGEKVKGSTNLTADFSVATAKVLAPTATTDVTKNLERLLHGETSISTEQSNSNSKLDGLALKTDSLEVKLNEAKQMIKYLSQDVKSAIEDYKSPFTRIKVQLNPQRLGEVDLTIVQRGKNLHVNISSNNAAINTLSMNANELRVQLNNSGINNASLNFNNSSGGEQQTANQQQNRQNEKRANEEYSYFENEDKNEEILSSLEIVVPNYA
jgi:flagellar hook-length control protein FliK